MDFPFLSGLTLDRNKVPNYKFFRGEFKVDVPLHYLNAFSDAPFLNAECNAHLQKIIEKINKQKQKNIMTVKHNNRYNLGRFYADEGHSLVCLKKGIKHTLFSKMGWLDIDMVKGHPTILFQLGKANGIQLDAFKSYLDAPSQILGEVYDFYKTEGSTLTLDHVKDFFNLSIYGGSFQTWINQLEKKQVDISTDEQHLIFKSFHKDCKILIKTIVDANQELFEFFKSQHEKDTDYDVRNRTMSYFCGTIENHILHICYKILCEQKIITPKKNVLLESDGICAKPLKSKKEVEETLVYINKSIEKETGVAIQFIVKPYKDENIHNEINLSPPSKEPKSLFFQTFKLLHHDETYRQLKQQFEKTYFKLEKPLGFGKEHEDGSFVLYKRSEFFTLLKDLDTDIYPTYSLGEFPHTPTFLEVWELDPNKRCYQKIEFNPKTGGQGGSPKYNLFNGFRLNHDLDEVDDIDVDTDKVGFFKLLLHLVCGNDAHFKYILAWVASLIQRPSVRTKTAIVFFSDTKGVGKDTIGIYIERLLGKKYTHVITTIDDLSTNFNSRFESKLFVRGEEICAKAKKYKDLLKTLITRETKNIERKGFESYEVLDLVNYFFTTNHEFDMPIEHGDRRFAMFRVNNKKLSGDFYRDIYEDELENETKLKMIFKFLMHFNLDNQPIGRGYTIQTDYKDEIMIEDKPAYIQFLFKDVDTYANKVIKASLLFDMMKNYANKHYLSKTSFNPTQVGIVMNKIFGSDIKTRMASGNVYDFTNLSEEALQDALKKYDEAYYNYVNMHTPTTDKIEN